MIQEGMLKRKGVSRNGIQIFLMLFPMLVLFVSADPFDLLKLHTVQWFYKPGICGAGKLFPPYKRYNLVEGSIKYISVYLDGICDPDPPLAVTGYSGKWQNKRKEFF